MADFLTTVLSGITKRFRDMGDTSFAEVVSLPAAAAAPLAANTAFDARAFGAVEVQYDGTGTVTVLRSKDGVTYYPWQFLALDGTPVTSITSAGIYSVRGTGWLKFSATVLVDGSN